MFSDSFGRSLFAENDSKKKKHLRTFMFVGKFKIVSGIDDCDVFDIEKILMVWSFEHTNILIVELSGK